MKWCWWAARRACPHIQAIVRELFGREPHKERESDEVVAVGAAVQGGVLGGVRMCCCST
jgi:molecular chaperone DnaK (HSP70)